MISQKLTNGCSRAAYMLTPNNENTDHWMSVNSGEAITPWLNSSGTKVPKSTLHLAA